MRRRTSFVLVIVALMACGGQAAAWIGVQRLVAAFVTSDRLADRLERPKKGGPHRNPCKGDNPPKWCECDKDDPPDWCKLCDSDNPPDDCQ